MPANHHPDDHQPNPHELRSFSSVLTAIEDGRLHSDVTDALVDLIAAMENHVQEHGGKVSGKLSLTIDLKLDGGVFELVGDHKVTKPKPKAPPHPDVGDPGQPPVPHRPAAAVAAAARGRDQPIARAHRLTGAPPLPTIEDPMDIEENVAQTTAKLMERLHRPEIVKLNHPRDDVQALILLTPGEGGFAVESAKKYLDEFRATPERRAGGASLSTLDSLIAHANRFKDRDSALFAKDDPENPSLTAVLDYHERRWDPLKNEDGNAVIGADFREDAEPRWGLHRGVHRFPVSEEWRAWEASNKKQMAQADFAAFLEDRILDILPAPTFDGDLSENDRELLKIQDLLKGTWAGPERMMELARGLTVHEASKVGSIVNLASGEGAITFETEHQTATGERLVVPSLFLVGIPVFEGGDRFRTVVRLRYRKNGGIVWFYELYRPDRIFKTAFREGCSRAAEETGLPLFYGTPEA